MEQPSDNAVVNFITDNKYILSAATIGVIWCWYTTRHPHKKNHLKVSRVGPALRIINVITDLCRGTFFGYSPIKVKKQIFIKQAKEIAASTDITIFGAQDDFIEGVEKYVNGLQVDLFRASGIMMLNSFCDRALAVRKIVIDFIQENKDILTVPLENPIIITGLPRTGSTMLYNLLSCDPNSRTPRFFEMSQMGKVVPPSSSEQQRDQDPRILECLKRFDEVDKLFPGIYKEAGKSHYSHPNEIEEDVLVMFHNFLMEINVPLSDKSYQDWYENEDNKEFAYVYHYRFFQMLNYYWKPKSHWVLKAPIHSTYLNALHQCYPTAKLIFTHRNPCEVVPSYTRLNESYNNWYYNNYTCDRIKFGRFTLDSLILCAQRLIKFKKNLNTSSYIDIVYEDMVKDPIATVEKIYLHFGLEFTKEFEENMENWLKGNRQGKYGRREYSLDDYQLTSQQIIEEFKDYIEIHNIPLNM